MGAVATPEVLAAAAPCLTDLEVDACHDMAVYVTSAVRFVTITGCQSCLVFVGAAAESVIVKNCADVRVIAACRRVYVSSCRDTTLHLWTPAEPVLLGDNRGILLAPHNAHYAQLRADLVLAGLGQVAAKGEKLQMPPNLWDQPFDGCGDEGNIGE